MHASSGSPPDVKHPSSGLVLDIAVGHWPQFQHLANQNPFWSVKFTVYFNGIAINNLHTVI